MSEGPAASCSLHSSSCCIWDVFWSCFSRQQARTLGPNLCGSLSASGYVCVCVNNNQLNRCVRFVSVAIHSTSMVWVLAPKLALEPESVGCRPPACCSWSWVAFWRWDVEGVAHLV